jgi:hypothetical protein
MAVEGKARLRKLLNYWMEHNQEHSQEVRDWAGRAQALGEVKVAEEMLRAAQAMETASGLLSQSLKILGEE